MTLFVSVLCCRYDNVCAECSMLVFCVLVCDNVKGHSFSDDGRLGPAGCDAHAQ